VRPTPKLWIVKSVIARGEVSSWIAPPGKGKSALMTDIAVHVAHGKEWRGYPITQPAGVVYFALERADLVKRRLAAHRLRDQLPDNLPIAVAGQIISLIDKNCVDMIVDAIKRAEAEFGRKVGLIICDTRAKGIAAGGGDEDKARFQNLAAANLRRVIEQTGVHIASVGHTGKDAAKGERGSNATLGDVDLEVTISGETVRTAEITKANDQPLGALTGYDLEPFEFADDEDGHPYRTFIVSNQILAGVSARRTPHESKTVQIFRSAFIEVVDGAGQSIIVRAGAPPSAPSSSEPSARNSTAAMPRAKPISASAPTSNGKPSSAQWTRSAKNSPPASREIGNGYGGRE
jgi:hypothetical protein